MSLYNDKSILRQIIISHYDQPNNKVDNESNLSGFVNFHNKSTSCIDDINIFIKLDGNDIIDAKFVGLGCAISTASSDIFCDILKNKTIDEANIILDNYKKMIANESYDEEILEELNAFKDIYLQPNRIKCSLIGFDAISNILKDK